MTIHLDSAASREFDPERRIDVLLDGVKKGDKWVLDKLLGGEGEN